MTHPLFRSQGLTQSLGLYLPITALNRLIGLARAVLLVWLMTRQEFGLLSLALLVINVATPLCSLGLNDAVARYVPQHQIKQTLRSFARTSSALVLIVAAALTATLACLAPSLAAAVFGSQMPDQTYPLSSLRRLSTLLQLAAAATLGLVLYWLVAAVLRGLRMFRALSLMELGSGVLFAASALGAAFSGWATAQAILACYLLSVLLPATLFGLGCARQLHRMEQQPARLTPAVWPPLLRYGVWIAAATIMWQLLQHWPMWLLNKLGGPDPTAIYAAVRQIAQLVMIAAGAIATVLAAAVTRTWEAEGPQTARRQLRLAIKTTGLALLWICVALSLLKYQVIRLFRHDYADGAAVLPVMLGFFLVVGMLGLLVIGFALLEKTNRTLAVYALGVLANVLLGLFLMGAAARGSGHLSWADSLLAASPATLLGAAAWTGLLAAAAAMLLCLALLQPRPQIVDKGTYLVLFSFLLLGLRWPFMLAGAIVLAVASFWGVIIFSASEKDLLRGALARRIRSPRPNP